MFKLISIILISVVLSSAPALAKKVKAVSTEQHQQQTVHLNKASAEELSSVLTGVGLSKAEAIVSYRKSNGPFKTINDLVNVKGIGAATIEKNLTRLKL
jgi:competence protein ComEA